MNGRPPAAATAADVDQFQRRLREVAVVLIMDHEQLSLAALLTRLTTTLVPPFRFHNAMHVLNDHAVSAGDGNFVGDPVLYDDFRRSVNLRVIELSFQEEPSYDERMFCQALPDIVLQAARQAAGLVPPDEDAKATQQQPYRDGGFVGAVLASAAAVLGMKKQSFDVHAAGGNGDDEGGLTECSICFKEFVNGGQVRVMPCPSRMHKFHPGCIVKWLAVSNMCPLCRHELPLCKDTLRIEDHRVW